MANHSPVKTRQNVRQTMLRVEELERIQFLKQSGKQEKSSDIEVLRVAGSASERPKKQRQGNSDEGPFVKKSRRQNSILESSDQDTSLLQNSNTSTSSIKLSPQINITTLFNRTPANNTMISGFSFSNANGSCSNNTSFNSSLNQSQSGAMNGIDSNPIDWKTDDVIKYLVENKFDQHLNLIKEHVSQVSFFTI